ncbi:macrolide ABC transporter ATP-binding protein [Brachybacterium phenoliresistens]|uniref:Macrolide ABC transporter ATP-binding protein n=1 Tax=Brachybacterium phenoliresistens TaxID=396014 RepID=Z9JUQ2_9MICO|nr:ABC transporter ATP-binding protein [Brachybacterium phenoliresistens]EWS81768.1 macrolide ABC transporter ATP-binding protein [Brachybacterium phenoliresistens]
MNAALEMRAVRRVHGSGPGAVTALDGIDLCVERGEFVAVMGPSGSGKSTLLQIAGGLSSPTAGDVLVEGRSLPSATAAQRAAIRRSSVGYVFQDLSVLPSLTALENVMLPLELDGLPFRSARETALEALEAVGIGDLADRFPEAMSGGQAQRVAIARGVVGPRRLLLADEPTGALDSRTGLEVIELLRARADAGAAVVLVTHEPRFAAWADRTVQLRDGRIIGQASPTDPGLLLAEPGGAWPR